MNKFVFFCSHIECRIKYIYKPDSEFSRWLLNYLFSNLIHQYFSIFFSSCEFRQSIMLELEFCQFCFKKAAWISDAWVCQRLDNIMRICFTNWSDINLFNFSVAILLSCSLSKLSDFHALACFKKAAWMSDAWGFQRPGDIMRLSFLSLKRLPF